MGATTQHKAEGRSYNSPSSGPTLGHSSHVTPAERTMSYGIVAGLVVSQANWRCSRTSSTARPASRALGRQLVPVRAGADPGRRAAAVLRPGQLRWRRTQAGASLRVRRSWRCWRPPSCSGLACRRSSTPVMSCPAGSPDPRGRLQLRCRVRPPGSHRRPGPRLRRRHRGCLWCGDGGRDRIRGAGLRATPLPGDGQRGRRRAVGRRRLVRPRRRRRGSSARSGRCSCSAPWAY